MPNPRYQTRLPNDIAAGIDQYTDDHEITESEILRRAVTDFLDERGYPKHETDGGAPRWARSAILDTGYRSALYSIYSSLALAVLILTDTAPTLQVAAYAVAVGGIVMATALLLLALTTAPEFIDRHTARHIWRLRYPEVTG